MSSSDKVSHNVYFDGKVQSLGIETEKGKATVGVMKKGTYVFNTTSLRTMVIISGNMVQRWAAATGSRTRRMKKWKQKLHKKRRFMKDLPAWVTGVKLNYSTYKDSVLETSGAIGVGFLWKKGQNIQKLKASTSLYGYRNPAENDFWINDEWNNRKLISHPAYSYLKLQKSKE
jgi:uncharacterized protein YaiE (UPF0345 family)